MLVTLISQSWYLFEQIWETRNEILHSSDSHAAVAEKTQNLSILLNYKRKASSLLHFGDCHHIDYSENIIAQWNRVKQKRMVAILDRLHRLYKEDCVLQAEGQKKLTSYDFYIVEREMVGD